MKIKRSSSLLIKRILKNTAKVCGDIWLPEATPQTHPAVPGHHCTAVSSSAGPVLTDRGVRMKQHIHIL